LRRAGAAPHTLRVVRSQSRLQSEYRQDAGNWLIELRLRESRQLFHHLDPAPFREKDLDPAAEAYIEDAVREIGHRRPARLVIHLPAGERGAADALELPQAVAHYFEYRARQTGTELARLLGRALANLVIGLLFLFACLTLRRTLEASGSHELLAEGLLIIGWVALWRPVEMFLYDWWPLQRRQRRLAAIARMPVEVRTQDR
jgi:hypothetical protein